ncbi:MAG: Imm42 family immunity protein [Lysobacterales bacterium]
MKINVGNPASFSIKVATCEDDESSWMFGYVCFFCDGCQVGDFDCLTSLRDVLFALDRLSFYRNQRSSPSFSVESVVDMFVRIERAFYKEEGINDAELATEEQWARHKIIPGLPSFDGWKGYLVEDENAAAMAFSARPYVDVRTARLERGEVDRAIDEVRMRLEEVHTARSKER